jgi:hypothetical protein
MINKIHPNGNLFATALIANFISFNGTSPPATMSGTDYFACASPLSFKYIPKRVQFLSTEFSNISPALASIA